MEIVLLGTVWFWVTLIVACLILFWEVEAERGELATVTIVVSLLALQFLTDIKVFTYVGNNPSVILPAIAGYFVLGTLWSFGKWWFFVQRKKKGYKKALTQYKERSQLNHTRESLDSESRPKVSQFKPVATSNKGRILVWMMYWPWSMAWTIIDDPVKEVFARIFDRARKIYQSIADRAFEDFENGS